MILDSVELWDTDVCFLHIQLSVTNVRLPKIRKTPPEVDFESSRSPAMSESWKKPSLQCCAVFYHMTILSEVVRVMNVWNQSCQTSVASLSPSCDCSCKFVDRPQNVLSTTSCQVQAFQDNLCAYFWQFSNWFKFFLLELVITQARASKTLYDCSVFLFLSSQYFSTHFRACCSMSWDHATVFAWGCSPNSTFFINFFRMESHTLLLSGHFDVIHVFLQESKMFLMNKETFSIRHFAHPSSNRVSLNCPSHKRPASGCPYKFRSRGTTGSSMFAHDSWLWNSEQSGSVVQFYLSVGRHCISSLSVTIVILQ